MAITSFDLTCDKVPKSSCSTHSSKGGNSCRLLKINIAADNSLCSAASKRSRTKKMNSKSPYLTSDRVQLLSRVTEKRLVHKKTTDFVSSFPMAVNIYKANSDEFKSSRKVNKKVKKSVLTLPNDPAPVPQVCTVSDMNDSEYCEKIDADRKQKIIKKRPPIQSNRKARVKEKDFEFYDRDAQYCSQLNINLDSSSTDMMKNFNGDGKRISNKKKILPAFSKPQTTNNNLNDVWTVLRNINRFQFRPSPPMSEESIIPVKKKVQKRRTNRKDTRVIETRRTEEFAYISSYELDDKTPRSFSPTSSIDRITVIDKQNEFSKICQEFEKRLLKSHDFLKDSSNSKTRKNKIQCRNPKGSAKALTNVGAKENKQAIAIKKKKKANAKTTPDTLCKTEQNNNIGENKNALIDADNLQISDNSDVLSNSGNDSMYAAKGSFIFSEDCSGLSNAEFTSRILVDKSPGDSSSQLKKPTSKELLSKDIESPSNSAISKRFDEQKRKPRLVTTMPSSCMMPKLTQTEIKRRLANIRFPIVILGKDQVSSSVKVMDCDPPQFNGLEDHIWPFMIEWSDNNMKEKHHTNVNKKCNSYLTDSHSAKSRKNNAEVGAHKQAVFKDKRQANNDLPMSKKKGETIRGTPCAEITDKLLQCSKKQKSIVQLKDKMLNFLYKKASSRNFINESNQHDGRGSKTSYIAGNKVDAATETQTIPFNALVVNNMPRKRAYLSSPPTINKKSPNYTYPWAKAKWASDFIENVIKKIRSGVYYTQEQKDFYQKYRIHLKEVSVQAGSILGSTDSTQTCDDDTDYDSNKATKQNNLTSIPGFTNTLPMLEIKSLNMNQIAVKHCVTNVMVQFDVTVPTKSDQSLTSNINKSLSLIPVEVTESHTKVYKCKTTILNAMLPAELCSILPRMMSRIIDSNYSDRTSEPCPSKTDSCLSTITELTRYETADSVCTKKSSYHTSPAIRCILEGRFSNKIPGVYKPVSIKPNYIINYNTYSAIDLLPMVSLEDLSEYEVSPVVVELDNTEYIHSQIALATSSKDITGVTDMQNPVQTAMEMQTVNTGYKTFNVVGMIESLLRRHNLQINFNLSSYFDMLKLHYDGKNIKINMSMTNAKGVQKNMLVTVTNLKIDSLYKASPKINKIKTNLTDKKDSPLKCIEYINTSLARKSENTEISQVTTNKTKRKGFYKLYRKCKSTTNIPSGEKSVNTPLSKVTTLDDFFQILGSKKMLCNVFDGYAAKKILSSIMEMKNWITEINPKQALLILLLTNKKDTPNLVRFRPILLQGIAVNRITRATELDMEIEVIERENLNKFSQYEGISYLPESVTNYDNLMEELYWIAKTTASDYQRPFDESSERLLKSLLEKRKKLNPSYLRVMARYVGLGLLKSPTKY